MNGTDVILKVISVVSTVCAVIFGYAAFHARRKQTDTDSGRDSGVMLSDIGYIKAGVDDLKREQREMNVTVGQLSERVTRVEESAKQAHKRINELKGIKGETI